jgi:hypothetical protein
MQGETGVDAAPQQAVPEDAKRTTPAEDAKDGNVNGEGVVSGDGAKETPKFVAPSSYLRPVSRGQVGGQGAEVKLAQRQRPLTPVDREQREGLVSIPGDM